MEDPAARAYYMDVLTQANQKLLAISRDAVLEKYAEHGSAQFKLPDILEVPPFNEWGNVIEIARRFGGGRELRSAVTELQRLLYIA